MEKNINDHNFNVGTQLENIIPNYEILQNNLKDVISYIRINSNVRKKSLFGIMDILFVDIWPKINEKSVSEERKKLDKEIVNKIEKNQVTVNK